MSEELDAFVNQIQNEIFNQTEQEYGQAFLERWKNPKFIGKMDDPSSFGQLTGSCQDQMEIYLFIQNDTIEKASFTTTGCGPSIVCASLACELAIGKHLEEAANIEGEDIIYKLEKLPEEKKHCAYLAAQTLREAIRRYWFPQESTILKGGSQDKDISENI